MPEVECQDSDEPAAGRVCSHLFQTLGGSQNQEHYRRFTGVGADYVMLCPECEKSKVGVPLHWVCADCQSDVAFGKRVGEQGRPEIRQRDAGLNVEHISLGLTQGKLLQAAAINSGEWLAIDKHGSLLRIDSKRGIVTKKSSLKRLGLSGWRRLVGMLRAATLSPSYILLVAEPLALIASSFSTDGVVFDLNTGNVTMNLRRGNYLVERCLYPVAFFESSGRLLLAHGTDWNRLDISDPFTGECLTSRVLPTHRGGGEIPDHYLDYFHGGLQVSPGGEWITSNGWAWHPRGIVRSWSLRQWLSSNLWESEDGESVRRLCHRDSYWDGPLCWVGESTVAVWGLGDDDNVLVPGARLFDVRSGEELSTFTGPQIASKDGWFLFDEFLFSYDAGCELGIWDVTTGERVFRDDSFVPLAYSRDTRTFLYQDKAGALHLARFSWPAGASGR